MDAVKPEPSHYREPVSPKVFLLTICSALSATSIVLNIAASPLVGESLAPRPELATLPLSLQILGTMATALPASFLMKRIGRRAGFAIGTLLGSLGAATAAVGIIQQSFWLFALGSIGIGALNGFGQLYRFAATEVTPTSTRNRAISWVLAGGVLAGVVGPSIASGASDWISSATFAGSYLAMMILHAIILVVLGFTRLPAAQRIVDAGARPLRVIVGDRRFLLGLGSAMIGYASMSLVMTAAPLSIVRIGFPFSAAAIAIQAHVVAMFLPSFFTGRLIDRFGTGAVLTTGAAMLGGTVLTHLSGTTMAHFIAGMILLGVGWNFMFIAGTSIVAGLHTPAERAKVQGVNDVLVFGGSAAGSLLAGVLLNAVGWDMLHMIMGATLVCTMMLLWLVRPRPGHVGKARVDLGPRG